MQCACHFLYNLRQISSAQVSEDDTAPATWRPGGPVVEGSKAAAPSKKYVYKVGGLNFFDKIFSTFLLSTRMPAIRISPTTAKSTTPPTATSMLVPKHLQRRAAQRRLQPRRALLKRAKRKLRPKRRLRLKRHQQRKEKRLLPTAQHPGNYY